MGRLAPGIQLQQVLGHFLHRYLRALEGALIDLCAECGVAAERNPQATGVWTGSGHKLGSIGIAVRRWISFHSGSPR